MNKTIKRARTNSVVRNCVNSVARNAVGKETQGGAPPAEGFYFATSSGGSLSFNLRFPLGTSITVDWGDETETVYNGNGNSNVTLSKTYAAPGSYDIRFNGDWQTIFIISCASKGLSGDISGWAALTDMTVLTCNGNSFTGNISGWSAFTNIQTLFCHDNNFTGDVSSWSTFGAVNFINCSNNSLTGDLSSWAANTTATFLNCSGNAFTGLPVVVNAGMQGFNFQNNTISTAAIDAWLAATDVFFASNAPTINCTYTLDGDGMGDVTNGESNANLVSIKDAYTTAGRTATFLINFAVIPSSTLLDGMVAFWGMDEASGAVMTDKHTNAITGALTDITPNGADYLFNGTSSQSEVADNDLLSFLDNNFTLSAWVKADDLTTNKSIIRKATEYHLFLTGNDIALRVFENGTSTFYYIQKSVITDTGWHHVLVTSTGLGIGDLKMYIDGVDESIGANKTAGTNLMANTANPFYVGRQPGTSNYWKGNMKQMIIWDRALTGEEVTEAYNGGSVLVYDDLVNPPAPDPVPDPDLSFRETADYYVSSSTGNDANDGLTKETAWATISKVNGSSFLPGDVVAFKAGDSFEGTLTPPNSGTAGNPVIFSAYGTGARPKIHGSVEITGWTVHSGNIYKTTLANDINQLFLDGQRIQLARMPKAGYFDVLSVGSTTQFTSSGMPAISHIGAKAVIRTNKWGMATRSVTGSSGQTLTINSAPQYTISVGDGFFLNNKLEYLTQAGEYYYDSATNTVYLWTPNGDSPVNYEVRGSVTSNLVSIISKDYVSVEFLELAHSSGVAANVDYCTYLTFDNVKITCPDSKGININHDAYGTYKNMIINEANHIALHAQSTSNSSIIDNAINNTALFANLGLSGMGNEQDGRAITVSAGTTNTIRYNRIINVGYTGINWNTPNSIIDKNFISNACLVKDDGGAIYTFASSPSLTIADGSEVTNNIVLYTRGNNDGTNSAYSSGFGIYMDNNIKNVLIKNNTIGFTGFGSIYLHENNNITVDGNTILDGLYGVYADEMNGACSIVNNIIYVYAQNFEGYSDTRVVGQRNGAVHAYNNNKYYSKYITGTFRNQDSYYTFSNWKSVTGQDAASTYDGAALGAGEVEELVYNDTKFAKNFALVGSYRDLEGNAVSSPLTLQPFTSKILIKE